MTKTKGSENLPFETKIYILGVVESENPRYRKVSSQGGKKRQNVR